MTHLTERSRFVWEPGDVTIIHLGVRMGIVADILNRMTAQMRLDLEEPGIDAQSLVPVLLDYCWRCENTKIDPQDDVGLCEPCKTELREM